MRVSQHLLIRAAFLFAAIACFCMAMASMYESGCAGDLKTGSYGDMGEALRLETRAAGFAGLGAILAALVVASLPVLGIGRKIAGAASVVVVSYIFFLFCGVYSSTAGVQACFP
jgi:hypothetical protein